MKISSTLKEKKKSEQKSNSLSPFQIPPKSNDLEEFLVHLKWPFINLGVL